MEKFNNKYRIESARAPWWDYGRSGSYFITICTKNREHYFGEINEGKMVLSPTGVIADLLWHEIPYHSQNVELDEFVVMPNHIHGILILNGNDLENNNNVDTGHALYLRGETNPDLINNPNYHPRFRNPGKNTVSSIIGGHKSAEIGRASCRDRVKMTEMEG